MFATYFCIFSLVNNIYIYKCFNSKYLAFVLKYYIIIRLWYGEIRMQPPALKYLLCVLLCCMYEIQQYSCMCIL
jgi:hypothetical protein